MVWLGAGAIACTFVFLVYALLTPSVLGSFKDLFSVEGKLLKFVPLVFPFVIFALMLRAGAKLFSMGRKLAEKES